MKIDGEFLNNLRFSDDLNYAREHHKNNITAEATRTIR